MHAARFQTESCASNMRYDCTSVVRVQASTPFGTMDSARAIVHGFSPMLRKRVLSRGVGLPYGGECMMRCLGRMDAQDIFIDTHFLPMLAAARNFFVRDPIARLLGSPLFY